MRAGKTDEHATRPAIFRCESSGIFVGRDWGFQHETFRRAFARRIQNFTVRWFTPKSAEYSAIDFRSFRVPARVRNCH
jgi:hypothetical protein